MMVPQHLEQDLGLIRQTRFDQHHRQRLLEDECDTLRLHYNFSAVVLSGDWTLFMGTAKLGVLIFLLSLEGA